MAITITEGLNELKLLDSRITKGIDNLLVVDYSTETIESKVTKLSANAQLQSIKDLIERRDCIKSAIVKSNATTMVTVGQNTMTVAEAIERKSSIDYKYALNNRLVSSLSMVTRDVQSLTRTVLEKIDNSLEAIFGKDQAKNDDYITSRESMVSKRCPKLNDPLDISTISKKLQEDIEDFMLNVDTALSISNATTKVEI